jgi:hypothetical protein
MNKSKDRFNLEEEIFAAWNVVDEIDLLYKYIGDSPVFEDMNPEHCDKIMNFLLGMKTIYSVKFQNLQSTMEDLIENGRLA